ncbi:MAG TPA: hypothetical protein VNT60_08150 [Deinococcales bacterium]|nr:hypothetical protein [Deinococcales bacterium]
MNKRFAGLALALALTGVLSGCGQTAAPLPAGGQGPNGTQAAPGGQAGGPLPAELVGKWLSTTAGDTIYVTPGGSTSGSGTGVQFSFMADGAYRQDVYENVALYGCNTGYSGHVEGTARIVDGRIVLKATRATLRSWDCGGERPARDLSSDPSFMRQVSYTFTYTLSPDPSDTTRRLLRLRLSDGSDFQTLRSL